MNLLRLKEELSFYVKNTSQFEEYFEDWINDAVLEIASDFELPELKLREPATLNTTESNWLYDLPATYHKKVFKCRNSRGDRLTVGRRIQTIEELDYDHDETDDYVTTIAVEAGQIAIFPMADDTLSLWYYRLPVAMTDDDDTPDGIPSMFHERVILPKVIIKNSAILQDLTLQYPPEYFRRMYSEGLYGSPAGDVGMINYLAKSKGMKRHGGSDPLP
jgi:hypothetical protein